MDVLIVAVIVGLAAGYLIKTFYGKWKKGVRAVLARHAILVPHAVR